MNFDIGGFIEKLIKGVLAFFSRLFAILIHRYKNREMRKNPKDRNYE